MFSFISAFVNQRTLPGSEGAVLSQGVVGTRGYRVSSGWTLKSYHWIPHFQFTAAQLSDPTKCSHRP